MAKNIFVILLESLDGKNILKISALSEDPEKEEKVLRVAAYYRVSTNDIDQAISITFQIRECKKKDSCEPQLEICRDR